MAEKPAKKTISIMIKRERPTTVRTVVATGFRLRFDKETGLTEILLQASGQRGERISLDPVVMRSNLEMLKRYVAGLDYAEDDSAQKDDVTVGDSHTFANIVHFSRMGLRAETIFGAFSLSDWVEATRQNKTDGPEIKSFDALVAASTVSFQKKLLLELVLLLSQQEKE